MANKIKLINFEEVNNLKLIMEQHIYNSIINFQLKTSLIVESVEIDNSIINNRQIINIEIRNPFN
jgi:hypothetical protein